MTSTPVNVQGFVPGLMYGTNRMQGTENKGDFGKIFENQKNELDSVDNVEYADGDFGKKDEIQESKEAESVAAAQNSAESDENSNTVRETAETESEQSATRKDMEESGLSEEEMVLASEAISGAIADVKELLMQQLQMTEEEVDSLMQELNLSDVDLLEFDNVKALLVEASSAGDMTALLTDESLYSQSKVVETAFFDIMQGVEDALEMSFEEVRTLTEQMDDSVNVLKTETEEPVLVEVVHSTEEKVQSKVNTADKQGSAEQNLMQDNPFLSQQTQTAQSTDSITATSSQALSYATAETENIMRQIMDHMQVRLNAESTELNMQLHPESLGTLQIRISAKEGIMTAQFTAASETVKSVLEAQMVQLQQQFDQQNIKVEAIEVTVQSHAFESALENRNEHHAEEETKRNKTRRIDLNLLAGSEEIETEDRILAEMMEASGNSVDYLV